MRNALALAVAAAVGCGPATAPRGPSAPAPESFRSLVVSAPATSIATRGIAVLDDGIAVLACVDGRGRPGWRPGGVLAKLSRAGEVVATDPVPGCGHSRIVRAGDGVAIVRSAAVPGADAVVARYDAALHPLANATVRLAGAVVAVAGRPDGTVAIAALAPSRDFTPGLEVASFAPDGSRTASWRLQGDVVVTELVADGDGVTAVGRLAGGVRLDGAVLAENASEGPCIVHLGATHSWAHGYGSPALQVQGPPHLAKLARGYVVSMNVFAAHDVDDVPAGTWTVFARLDPTGELVTTRREPAALFEEVRGLAPLPDGTVLEHHLHQVDVVVDSACDEPHGCLDHGGPAGHGYTHELVVTRRDPETLEVIDRLELGGEMTLPSVAVAYSPAIASIVAVGTFEGTIALGRTSVASPLESDRPCAHARTSRAGGLFAMEPPIDPCAAQRTRHGALFATRLGAR